MVNTDSSQCLEGNPNTEHVSVGSGINNKSNPDVIGLNDIPCIQGYLNTLSTQDTVGSTPLVCVEALNPSEVTGRASLSAITAIPTVSFCQATQPKITSVAKPASHVLQPSILQTIYTQGQNPTGLSALPASNNNKTDMEPRSSTDPVYLSQLPSGHPLTVPLLHHETEVSGKLKTSDVSYKEQIILDFTYNNNGPK